MPPLSYTDNFKRNEINRIDEFFYFLNNYTSNRDVDLSYKHIKKQLDSYCSVQFAGYTDMNVSLNTSNEIFFLSECDICLFVPITSINSSFLGMGFGPTRRQGMSTDRLTRYIYIKINTRCLEILNLQDQFRPIVLSKLPLKILYRICFTHL